MRVTILYEAPDGGSMNVRVSCFPLNGDVMTPLFGRTNSLIWKLSLCPEAQTNYLSTNVDGRNFSTAVVGKKTLPDWKLISAFKVYKTLRCYEI